MATSPFEQAFLHGVDGVTEVVLVRHGQQSFPSEPRSARAGEYRDPPLSDVGQRQAQTVGRALARERVDHVYSSHLSRALETARQIAGHHGLDVEVREELQEFDLFARLDPELSMAEALSTDELETARQRFVDHRKWDGYPFAEPGEEFRDRVVAAVETILTDHAGEHIVIACHGGVINAVCAVVLDRSEDMFFRPAHASISRLGTHDDRRVVRSLSETGHLRAVDPALVTW